MPVKWPHLARRDAGGGDQTPTRGPAGEVLDVVFGFSPLVGLGDDGRWRPTPAGSTTDTHTLTRP